MEAFFKDSLLFFFPLAMESLIKHEEKTLYSQVSWKWTPWQATLLAFFYVTFCFIFLNFLIFYFITVLFLCDR